MDDKDASIDVDSDTPIYVGQSPLVSEQEQNDDDDLPLINVNDGFTQEQSSLVSCDKQSGDHPSLDAQQSMATCQALINASPDKLGMPSKYDGDTFNFGRGDGCVWFDDYSDDEDIRVGHDGKRADVPLRNEVLVSECKKRLLGGFSKLECSTVERVGNENMDPDCRSSPSKVPHYEHLCETISCADVGGTCDAVTKKGSGLEDLSIMNRKNHRTSNHDRSEETNDQPEGEECPDNFVNPMIRTKTPEMLAPDGDNDSTLTPNRAESSANLEDCLEASSSCIQNPQESRAEKSHHSVTKTFDSRNTSPLRRSPRKLHVGVKAEDVSKAQTFISESKPNDERLECSPATRRKSYSLRNRGRQTSVQEEMIKLQPQTPQKESLIVTCKDPKGTLKDEREVCSSSPTRRTSPRKQNKVNHLEDQTKDVHLGCGKIVNNKIEHDENDENGKERRSTKGRENVNTGILDQKRSGFASDCEVDDCEPACSQIYTGAPMISKSKTKNSKQSRRGNRSSCLSVEDVTGVGEEIQLKVDDTPSERVVATIPQPEQSLEEKERNSHQQSSCSDLNQDCVAGTCPSSIKVLKTSNRQRRRKQSYPKQNEVSGTVNEFIDAGKKNEQTVKRTQKVNTKSKTSKKQQKCLETKGDVIDDVIEPTQEMAQIENIETVVDLEKLEDPTPPEKRRIYRARRRGQSRGRKTVNDLINDLTAASASALKRVSESTSPPSSKENQESAPTGPKAKKRQAPRKGKVTKDRPSRKRKYRGCSPGEDDPELPDPVGRGNAEIKASHASQEQCATMLRSGSLSDNSGDDDDELINPVLTPDSKTKDLPPAFCVNDVVWAPDPGDKSRWPAVVIAVTGENVSRRVYNVFKTNQAEEKYFQVKSSRYIKPYNCKEKKKYLDKGKEMSEFNKAVEKADDFIMKMGLGKVESYKDFFKPRDAYLESPPPSPYYTSPPSPPLIVGHNIPNYPPTTPKASPHLIEDDDDDDDDDAEEEEGGRLNDSLHSVKSNSRGTTKEIRNLKQKWWRKEKRLLEHMRSTQTKEYLVGIQHGTVMSHRHQWFQSCKPSDKGRLLRGSFGALINEKKRLEIVNHLRELLASDKCLLSTPRYMYEVALPEALNLAYQKTNKVDKDKAEQLIHRDGQQVIRDLDIG